MYGQYGPQIDWYGSGSGVYIPTQYPTPPAYPTSQVQLFPAPTVGLAADEQLNPAERAIIQAEIKEGKESKEQGAARASHKGTRKSYIPEWGEWPTKKEMLDRLKNERAKALEHADTTLTEKGLQDLLKDLDRKEFAIMRQYNLSKHEPLPYSPGKFGGMNFPERRASDFYIGGFSRKEDGSSDFNKYIKGWRDMSPAEKDAEMSSYNASKNTPKRIAKQEEVLFKEFEKQAQQQAERRRNLSPAEREQENYNRQVAEYFEQQHRNEYQNQSQFLNRNRQIQGQQGFSNDINVPQPVMNELISMINSQPVRYVPIRPRPSFNDRIMNSFGQNMFSPEFIPEEE